MLAVASPIQRGCRRSDELDLRGYSYMTLDMATHP
jgi:hypothetical protein